MELEYAGIAIVPLIVGLVEVAKRLGLEARWAPLLALGLGLAISLGWRAAGLAPDGQAWMTWVWWG